MTCEEAMPLLSAYLDGETTPEERAAIAAHLADCASCRAILEEYRKIDEAIASLEATPPASLRERVMREIQKRPSHRRRTWAAVVAAAAVLAVAIAVGGLPGLEQGRAAVTGPAAARALSEEPEASAPLLVELTDDPNAPAAETLPALQDLTACVQGEMVEYWTDAATAREILTACEGRYQVNAPEALAKAAGEAPCTIRIVQP